MKVQGKKAYEWRRPDEMHPGFTRALVIEQPPAVATCRATHRLEQSSLTYKATS